MFVNREQLHVHLLRSLGRLRRFLLSSLTLVRQQALELYVSTNILVNPGGDIRNYVKLHWVLQALRLE
jgi:hypothetical protein